MSDSRTEHECHFQGGPWLRICPFSLPDGCTDVCMRFEATEETEGAREIWEEHMRIVDAEMS